MQLWQQVLAPPHFQPQNFPPLPPDSLPLPRAALAKAGARAASSSGVGGGCCGGGGVLEGTTGGGDDGGDGSLALDKGFTTA